MDHTTVTVFPRSGDSWSLQNATIQLTKRLQNLKPKRNVNLAETNISNYMTYYVLTSSKVTVLDNKLVL